MTDGVTTSAILGFHSHFSNEPWLPGTRFFLPFVLKVNLWGYMALVLLQTLPVIQPAVWSSEDNLEHGKCIKKLLQNDCFMLPAALPMRCNYFCIFVGHGDGDRDSSVWGWMVMGMAAAGMDGVGTGTMSKLVAGIGVRMGMRVVGTVGDVYKFLSPCSCLAQSTTRLLWERHCSLIPVPRLLRVSGMYNPWCQWPSTDIM